VGLRTQPDRRDRFASGGRAPEGVEVKKVIGLIRRALHLTEPSKASSSMTLTTGVGANVARRY
jgi:hypothetical protein